MGVDVGVGVGGGLAVVTAGNEDVTATAADDSVAEPIASGLGVALAAASVASSAGDDASATGDDTSATGVALGASGAALASEPALCVAWEHPEMSAQQMASRAIVYQSLIISRW